MKLTLWILSAVMLVTACLGGFVGCGGDNTAGGTTTAGITDAITDAVITDAVTTDVVTTDVVTTEVPEPEPQFVAVNALTEGVVAKKNGFVYLDATADLISLGGIAAPANNGGEYFRLVSSHKSTYPEDIQKECATMAGGTLRFLLKGNTTIRIKATRRTDYDFNGKIGNYSFDIYVGSGTERTYYQSVTCPFGQDFESEDIVLPEGEQEVMICLPYNMGFASLQVAVKEDASIAAPPVRLGGVIGFYGSSITQGSDAITPSLSYAMRLCREMDADCMNFGLSGAARGEKVVIEDICAKIKDAGLTAFILDYDWNINSSVELMNGSTWWNGYGHYTIYEKLRAALGPDVPIIMLSRPWYGGGTIGVTNLEAENCIAVIRNTYNKAKNAGDDAVAFLAGKYDFFGDEARFCHTDFIHPNDRGHELMAIAVKAALVELLSAS